ncbi:ABC transporter ATP-binding protein [Cellulomonas algicola]|uniref:ABC transporter ATP-binding protein n=1 Tax=Cellulomonas algicola TaxID=2071633 RepID=UPI0027DF71A6|nr:ABC transporter ATP-binding protein [Cellulomonas algicola]
MTGSATLRAHDLTFGYRRNAAPVFEAVDIDFRAGALTALTGSSGSGKSTLLYVLATLLTPTRGQVLWDGSPTSTLTDGGRAQWRAQRTGFVFQDAMLDPSRTVLDNVCESALFAGVPMKVAHRRAVELLERLGVAHRVNHRPGEISGGQAQRVALCRALVTDPQVIFGDEPTGNLDETSAAVVWDTLRERAMAGATVIIATHDLRLAATADEQVHL